MIQTFQVSGVYAKFWFGVLFPINGHTESSKHVSIFTNNSCFPSLQWGGGGGCEGCDQHVKSSLSSSPITGSFWAELATFLVTRPVDRFMAFVMGLHGNVCCPDGTGRVTFMSNLSCCLVKIFVHMTHWVRHTPKSATRCIFSHNGPQKWGFCTG